MPTLYRKYRPQTFAELAGQEPIKMTLSFEITANRLAHAYLFCGPRAIGKTTMARLLAKSINCQERKEGSADPCNQCISCKEITQGNSLDIAEIDAASHTGVDNVRDSIIASARVSPSRSKYKVFIIDEAHMLSTAAFNALLKIMEEPPAHVVFILCTTEAHKLPTTIISRCQRFDFKKIGYAEIVKKLSRIATEEDISIEPRVIEAVARHSGGHMRDAESLFGQIISIGGKENSLQGTMITLAEAELIIPRSLLQEAITLLEHLISRDASSAVAYVNQLVEDGVDLKIYAIDVMEMARQAMLAKINPTSGIKAGLEFGESIESRLAAITSKFEIVDLAFLIERVGQASREIKEAPIAQLPLELAIVDFCFGVKPETSSNSFTPSPVARPQPVQSPKVSTMSASVNKIPSGKSSVIKFTQAALNDMWQELLVRVRQHNHSLAFVIKSCNPTLADDNSIRLAFKYKIHHDRITDPAIRGLVEGILADISGQAVNITAVIDPELVLIDTGNKSEASEEEDDSESTKIASAAVEAAGIDSSAIDNLLKTFGGKVVG